MPKTRRSNLEFLKEDLYLVVEGEIDEMFVYKIISFMPTKYNVRIRVANGNGNIPIHVNILKKIYSYSKIVVLSSFDKGNFTSTLSLRNNSLPSFIIFFINIIVITENNYTTQKEKNQDLFLVRF